MRVAILDAFPNLALCAEREFLERCLIALRNLSWEAKVVVTSDDICDFHPDCVLVTHEFSQKLTDAPTLGLMWSPPVFYRDDPMRVRNILSYDGYLAGSDKIDIYLRDLLFSTGKNAPIADFPFLPTCFQTEFPTRPLSSRSLFYAGVGWDGNRHGRLFPKLSQRVDLALHGPAKAWKFAGKAYRGEIAVDGRSVVPKIQEAGAALCIHKREHRQANVPSMRLFEAAAAGAFILCDRMPFIVDNFGDSVRYIEFEQSEGRLVQEIAEAMRWVQLHPEEAQEMARRAHAIFNERFSLETQFRRLPAFVQRVRERGHFDKPAVPALFKTQDPPTVEYIVRVGSRPANVVRRCVEGLSKQTYPRISLIFSRFAPVEGLEEMLAEYRSHFQAIKFVEAPKGMRSSCYWAGLRAVTAPYFGNCDDDDWLAPNHVATVLEAMLRQPQARLAYSGTVLVQDEPGFYSHPENFKFGVDKPVPENRRLKFFHPFEPARLIRIDNYVNSNAWIARSDLLDERFLEDPRMHVGEDFFLLLAFLAKSDFAFTWRPTAQWHFRSATQDNATFRDYLPGEDIGSRLALRFKFTRWGDRDQQGVILPYMLPQPPLLGKVRRAIFGVTRALLEPHQWGPRLRSAYQAWNCDGVRGLVRKSAQLGGKKAG